MGRSDVTATSWSLPPGRSLLRLAIPVGLLLLSIAIAYTLPSGRVGKLLLLAGPAVIALLIYLREPRLGILALIAAGLVIPLEVGTGTGSALNPVILLIPVLSVLWLLDSIVRRRGIHLHRHPSVYFVLALSATAVLSTVAGQLHWFSVAGVSLNAQLGGLMVFLLSAAAFLLAAHILNEVWLRRLVYLFLLLAAVYLLGRLISPLGALTDRLYRPGATGSLFWTWAVALSAGLIAFDTSLSAARRGLLIALLALLFAVALSLSGQWASGWVPAGASLLVVATLRLRRLGFMLLVVAVVAFFLRFDQIWTLVTDSQSWMARRQAWQIVLNTASVNPILGLGPANYYNYVQQVAIFSWGANWNVRFSSHNNFVDLVAQTGLAGLLFFLAFSYSIGRTGLNLFRRSQGGFVKAYAAACVAGLIGTLVSGVLGDWFLPFVYNIGLSGMRSSILFWVFLGGLLALALPPTGGAE